MIDNYNQNNVDDLVSGYNISEIQNALVNVETWNGWRNNLTANETSKGSRSIVTLFANWTP